MSQDTTYRFTSADANKVSDFHGEVSRILKLFATTGWGQQRGHFSPGVYRIFTPEIGRNLHGVEVSLKDTAGILGDVTSYTGTGVGVAAYGEYSDVLNHLIDAAYDLDVIYRDLKVNIKAQVWDSPADERDAHKVIQPIEDIGKRVGLLRVRFSALRPE